MYVCKGCGKRFEKPRTTIGSRDYWNECPYCGNSNFRSLKYDELKLEEKTLEQRVEDIERILGIRN